VDYRVDFNSSSRQPVLHLNVIMPKIERKRFRSPKPLHPTYAKNKKKKFFSQLFLVFYYYLGSLLLLPLSFAPKMPFGGRVKLHISVLRRAFHTLARRVSSSIH
jgi:hypothetical protein